MSPVWRSAPAAAFLAALVLAAAAAPALGMITPHPIPGSSRPSDAKAPPASPAKPAAAHPATPAGTARPQAAPAASSSDTLDPDTLDALRRGIPQDLLIVFDQAAPAPRAPAGGAAAAKAKVFAPTSAAAKAGVRVKQDYSMLPIALVTVPDLKALQALQSDPNILSISPNRRAYPANPSVGPTRLSQPKLAGAKAAAAPQPPQARPASPGGARPAVVDDRTR